MVLPENDTIWKMKMTKYDISKHRSRAVFFFSRMVNINFFSKDDNTVTLYDVKTSKEDNMFARCWNPPYREQHKTLPIYNIGVCRKQYLKLNVRRAGEMKMNRNNSSVVCRILLHPNQRTCLCGRHPSTEYCQISHIFRFATDAHRLVRSSVEAWGYWLFQNYLAIILNHQGGWPHQSLTRLVRDALSIQSVSEKKASMFWVLLALKSPIDTFWDTLYKSS